MKPSPVASLDCARCDKMPRSREGASLDPKTSRFYREISLYRAARLIHSAPKISRGEGSAIALVAALVLIIQALAFGYTLGAVAEGGVLGAVCATSAQQPAKSSPDTPAAHHAGACCILHADVYAGDHVRRTAQIVPSPPPELARPLPAIEIGALNGATELLPISPRAPPARSV
jgi:hypothetical protein